MWRRKTEDEKDADLRLSFAEKQKLKLPLIFAFVGSIVLGALIATGVRGRRLPPETVSFVEFLQRTPIYAAYIFPVLFVIMVYLQRRDQPEDPAREVQICPCCYHPQKPNPTGCERCGHGLEPLKNWRWVDSP